MLNTANKELLKSLGLKVAFGFVAVLTDTISANLGGFNIPASYALVIGLVLGDISQWAHTHYDLGGRIARAVIPKSLRK